MLITLKLEKPHEKEEVTGGRAVCSLLSSILEENLRRLVGQTCDSMTIEDMVDKK
jgi:hypothetical protein